MRLTLILLCALFLAGCGSPSADDLRPLIVSDLPPGVVAAEAAPVPMMLRNVPAAEPLALVGLVRDGADAGWIAVLVYADEANRKAAYTQISDGMTAAARPQLNLGERGLAIEATGATDVLFERCAAVVHLRALDVPLATLVDVARRLDARLMGEVC